MKKCLVLSILAVAFVSLSVGAYDVDLTVPNGGNSTFQGISNYALEREVTRDETAREQVLNVAPQGVVNGIENVVTPVNSDVEMVNDGKRGLIFRRRK